MKSMDLGVNRFVSVPGSALKLRPLLLLTVFFFAGIQFFLESWYSTGAHLDVDLGWVQLHRHGNDWSVSDFRLGVLAMQMDLSVFLAWVFGKLWRRRLVGHEKMEPES